MQLAQSWWSTTDGCYPCPGCGTAIEPAGDCGGKYARSIERVGGRLTADVEPEWVKAIVKPEWFSRYGQRFEQMRLPKERAEREVLMETIGADGVYLLEAVAAR